MSPESFITTAGGGALGVVAIYLCKICLTLVKQKSAPKSTAAPPATNSLTSISDQSNELFKIYAEIEHSKEDRKRMIELLGKCYGVLKDLHEMHDQKDEDGVLKWLNKPSIEREIKRIGRILDDMRKSGRRSGSSGQYSFRDSDKKE